MVIDHRHPHRQRRHPHRDHHIHPTAAGPVKMVWLVQRMSSSLLRWIQGDRYQSCDANILYTVSIPKVAKRLAGRHDQCFWSPWGISGCSLLMWNVLNTIYLLSICNTFEHQAVLDRIVSGRNLTVPLIFALVRPFGMCYDLLTLKTAK